MNEPIRHMGRVSVRPSYRKRVLQAFRARKGNRQMDDQTGKIDTRREAIKIIVRVLDQAMASTHSDEKARRIITAAIDYMVVHDGW